jgi:hypothetical protein
MDANGVFSSMECRFGGYADSGVVFSNMQSIRRIECEVEAGLFMNRMTDPRTLHVVYQPVGTLASAGLETNTSRWLLPFHAQETQMNVAVAHTMAKKLLETDLNSRLEGASGDGVMEVLWEFFQEHVHEVPPFEVRAAAQRLLDANAPAVATIGDDSCFDRDDVVHVVERGSAAPANSIPLEPSLVGWVALRLWRREAVMILDSE